MLMLPPSLMLSLPPTRKTLGASALGSVRLSTVPSLSAEALSLSALVAPKALARTLPRALLPRGDTEGTAVWDSRRTCGGCVR
jgi:hypothetical protein